MWPFSRPRQELPPVPEPVVPEVPVEEKEPKTGADIVRHAFDNEHTDGIHCTLTFIDGTESIGVAPVTGNLAADQAVAAARAIQAANT